MLGYPVIVSSWCHQSCVTFFLVSYLSLTYSEVLHSELDRFESLLAAGRPLAFPFSAGYLLSLASIEEANWNISWKGFENATGINTQTARQNYATLLQELSKDEDNTLTGTVYTLRGNYNSSGNSFDKLGAQIKQLAGDETNNIWSQLNADLVKSTSSKFDKQLIPSEDNEVGNPFPLSTEAVLMSTFRYQNTWDLPWAAETPRNFGDSGMTPFLQANNEFLVSNEEDFTAVSVPLQGGRKSLVLVLPAVNITKYFRSRFNLHKRASEESSLKSDSISDKNRGKHAPESEEDAVPLPTKWEKRNISLHIPSFNFSDADRFGEELVELGLNESFCTTVHDRVGAFPYYIRPLAQINSVEVGRESLEIMSATGTAVQKFFTGLDFLGNGYPRLKSEISKEFQLPQGLTPTNKSEDSTSKANDAVKLNLHVKSQESSSEGLPQSTIANDGSEVIIFDRPFLFYLNDARTGPLFYGIIESIKGEEKQEENMKDDDEKTAAAERELQVRKFLLWSCRRFEQTDLISAAEVKDEEPIKVANES